MYTFSAKVERWGVQEVVMPGKAEGNPFTDVEVKGEFVGKEERKTVYGFYDYYLQIQHMLHNIQNPVYQQKDIITVNPLVPVNDTIAMLSGYHLLFYVMSEDENDWRNVAVSRYYGIKGIRIIKKDIKK